MDQSNAALPYAGQFACIGAECEDTCCSGWTVPIDRPAFERFQQMPASALKTALEHNLERKPDGDSVFAILNMNDDSRCPMHASSGLCQLHIDHGETILAETCRQYPRYKQQINGETEIALALSCPEAARLVLFHPNLLDPDQLRASGISCKEAASPLEAWAWPIRALVLRLITSHRNYPLWQRLFLLRIFCHRLDALGAVPDEGAISSLLRGFESSIESGLLRPGMDALPSKTEAQLDMVLQLAGLLLHESNLRPRFLECVQAFTAGIGNAPGATLDTLVAGYEAARERWLSPFLARTPMLLENWLSNAILRQRFPFGKQAALGATSAVVEFDMLSANFVLMRGLLTGVAGFHREQFSARHAVHTVQSASKHFEHHPEFLSKARALLRKTGLDDARGMAFLLHDGARTRPRTTVPLTQELPATRLFD